MMDDDEYIIYTSSEEDNYNYNSDEDSLNGIEHDDCEALVASFKGPSCKVITKESLLAAQRKDLRHVMELLSVKENHARTLLIHHRWDVDKLFAVLVEKGQTCLFSDAGVTLVENHGLGSFSCSAVTCAICMEDVPCVELTKMDCGHCFCSDCWTEYFIVKIIEGQSRRMRCMAHRCNAICDEAIVRSLVGKKHPDLVEKFDRFLLESYIEDNKMVKWCPSVPHCGNAIRIELDKFCEVECSCGLQFCFSCLTEAHSPCSCLMWELWSKKFRDESATVSWMTINTKPCPKCSKPVEKDGGCNLVWCICRQAFCWLCGEATGYEHTWTTIAGHSCGRFIEDKEEFKHAKLDLQRYIHYYDRYKAHMDSFHHEYSLKENVQDKVRNLEKKISSLVDFSWITNGLFRLFSSRRVLSYSYAFAFYMFGEELFKGEMDKKQREIKQNLFENQQQQLEQNLERLSKFVEEPFDAFNEYKLIETRMQIINLTAAIDNFCKKMYECIENDLLDSLQFSVHNIAPYQSKGIEKAAELSTTLDQNVHSSDKPPSDYATLEKADGFGLDQFLADVKRL